MTRRSVELALEYIAFGGSLLSAWLYGTHGYKGPIAGFATCIAFILFGYVTEMYAAVIANVIFIFVHSRNFRKVYKMDENVMKKKIVKLFSELQEACHEASYNAGWWHCPITGKCYLDHPELMLLAVPTKLMLQVSEVAEAMEGDRKDLMDDKLPHRPAIEVEMADAIIRIFDLAGAKKLDLGGAVAEKMAFNTIRPDHKIENRRKAGGKKY